MTCLLHSLIAVSAAFIINLFCRYKINYLFYLLFFVLTFFLCHVAKAKEYIHHHECYFGPEKIKEYVDKASEHEKQGAMYFESAARRTWWGPCFTNKQAAFACLQAASASALGPDLRTKALAACISLITTYSMACLDAWDRIERDLFEAEYNYEMADFYYEIIVRENNRYGLWTDKRGKLPDVTPIKNEPEPDEEEEDWS